MRISTASSRLNRRIAFGGCLVLGLLLSTAFVFWRRGVEQQQHVDELLLRFGDAFVLARYDPSEFDEPPTVEDLEDGVITLKTVWGGGQHRFRIDDQQPHYLAWVVPLLGEHCFARVTYIRLNDQKFSDADVDLVLGFPELRDLNISETAITDVGLTKIASLENLINLDVSGTRVSPKSLRHLSRCRRLRELNISDTNADEQSVDYLKKALPDCWILH